jgi:hypothetical protein
MLDQGTHTADKPDPMMSTITEFPSEGAWRYVILHPDHVLFPCGELMLKQSRVTRPTLRLVVRDPLGTWPGRAAGYVWPIGIADHSRDRSRVVF